MALALQLLPLLLWKANGDPLASLQGHPGDRVNLSCVGVLHPTRWAWAPSFPACKGLSKGRRPILWNSSSGTPTVSPLQHFAGRLRPLGTSIRRLELLLSAGDSGTFYCKGRQENESRTVLQVLGDRAYCKALGPTHGVVPRIRLDHSPHLLYPSHIALYVNVEPQRPRLEGEPKIPGNLEQEPSLHYANLDQMALRRPRRLSEVVSADASTVYAVVV
ncbi:PREDICTED: protein G6b isoform X3 [Dipodomys ordii]|uniref:Protein G6b isoform X3 n=1 Tax=Dipodomys ordii TaxID=10020 RepID=A0A1S3GD40_DIPOR|nr:PREDICTED: protein G6b isoform X3 [Dipodomys ordii]